MHVIHSRSITAFFHTHDLHHCRRVHTDKNLAQGTILPHRHRGRQRLRRQRATPATLQIGRPPRRLHPECVDPRPVGPPKWKVREGRHRRRRRRRPRECCVWSRGARGPPARRWRQGRSMVAGRGPHRPRSQRIDPEAGYMSYT